MNMYSIFNLIAFQGAKGFKETTYQLQKNKDQSHMMAKYLPCSS